MFSFALCLCHSALTIQMNSSPLHLRMKLVRLRVVTSTHASPWSIVSHSQQERSFMRSVAACVRCTVFEIDCPSAVYRKKCHKIHSQSVMCLNIDFFYLQPAASLPDCIAPNASQSMYKYIAIFCLCDISKRLHKILEICFKFNLSSNHFQLSIFCESFLKQLPFQFLYYLHLH